MYLATERANEQSEGDHSGSEKNQPRSLRSPEIEVPIGWHASMSCRLGPNYCGFGSVPSVSASACLDFLVVNVSGCPKLTARPRGHDCAAYLVRLTGLSGAVRGLICGFWLLVTDKYSE